MFRKFAKNLIHLLYVPKCSIFQDSNKLFYVFQDQKSLQQHMCNRQSCYPILINAGNKPESPLNRNIPLPVINLLQACPTKQIIRTPINNNNKSSVNNIRNINNEISPLTNNAMSPLSLNISSPMYSLPPSPNTSSYNSPNYSPAMSPAQRVLSPYSTPQSLSPVSRFQNSPGRLHSPTSIIQGSDPYLNNKMQPSPGFPLQPNDLLLDSNLSLTSPYFWAEPDMLLTAFDDVKID